MNALLNHALRFIAATALLHPVFHDEPAIAAQDRCRRRSGGISSHWVPQSHNGMRLQLGHHAKGPLVLCPKVRLPHLHCSAMQGLLKGELR
jgi:hypothetical protein